jgi:hypothetical protein
VGVQCGRRPGRHARPRCWSPPTPGCAGTRSAARSAWHPCCCCIRSGANAAAAASSCQAWYRSSASAGVRRCPWSDGEPRLQEHAGYSERRSDGVSQQIRERLPFVRGHVLRLVQEERAVKPQVPRTRRTSSQSRQGAGGGSRGSASPTAATNSAMVVGSGGIN